MADVMSPFRAAQADPNADARAAKARGQKVIGYLTNTAPVELIAASGAFPLLLTGAPGETSPRADRYMEPLFDPILRSAFERMLDGRYDFVDAVVLTRTSDSAHRLYYYLTELRRTDRPDLPTPLLFDLLHTPWYSSAEYNLARLGELRDAVGAATGETPSDAALIASISAAEQSRDRLRAFTALRRQSPAPIAAEDALAVFTASRTMTQASFDAAIDALLADPPKAPAATGPRIVVAGSPLDRPDLHRLVSAAGGTVVGDYHALGELMIGAPVELGGDPVRALCERYHRGVFSSRRYPQDSKALAAFASEAGADGVVFYFYAEEEALTWEYPAQRRALEAAGVASVCFEDQSYAFDAAAVAPRLSDFIQGLARGRAA